MSACEEAETSCKPRILASVSDLSKRLSSVVPFPSPPLDDNDRLTLSFVRVNFTGC